MAQRSTLKTARTLLDRFFRHAEGRTNQQLDVGFLLSELSLTRDKAESALAYLESRGLLNSFGPDVAFLTDEGIRVSLEDVDLARLRPVRTPSINEPPTRDAGPELEDGEERTGPQLVYVALDGRTFTVKLGAFCSIGRATESDVPIEDKRASKRHAVVRYAEGGYLLEDLESANGTLLNGTYCVSPTRLKNDDEIVIGGTMLVFQAPDGYPPPVDAFEPPPALSRPPEPKAAPIPSSGAPNSGLGVPIHASLPPDPEPGPGFDEIDTAQPEGPVLGPEPGPDELGRGPIGLEADVPGALAHPLSMFEQPPPLGDSGAFSLSISNELPGAREPKFSRHAVEPSSTFPAAAVGAPGEPAAEAEQDASAPTPVAAPHPRAPATPPKARHDDRFSAPEPETAEVASPYAPPERRPDPEDLTATIVGADLRELGLPFRRPEADARDGSSADPTPTRSADLDPPAPEPPTLMYEDQQTLFTPVNIEGAEELPVASPYLSQDLLAERAPPGNPRLLEALERLRKEVQTVGGPSAQPLLEAVECLLDHPWVRAFAEQEDDSAN